MTPPANKENDNDHVAEESSQNQSNKEESESASKEPPGKVVKISSIKHTSGADYTRITVSLDQKVHFESQRIDRPDRIFFDLKDARLASRLMGSSLNVDDGRVKNVRMAQFKPGLARIVIETDGQASFNASLMANPPRLVIDVQGNSPAGETACADSKSSGDCSRRGNDEEGKVVRASEKSLTASTDNLDSPAPRK